MAGYAYPTTAYNSRALTPREYEDLTSPQAPDGLIGDPSLPALVYADSTQLGVKVRANRAALIRGLRWESGTTEVSVSVAANATAGTTRKDLIVLRMSRNPWTAALAVVQGVAAPSPTTPSPTYGTNTSTGVWELPLAEVTVPYNDTLTDPAQCVPLAWYVGSDGQILATGTTMPPHEQGRLVYRADTNLTYVSTGSKWVTDPDDTGWVALTPASGWAANTLRIRRHGGVSFLHLDVRRTGANLAAGAQSTLTTIPADFRLNDGLFFITVVIYHAAVGRVSIASNGAVNLSNHGGVSTSQYLVGSASWPIG